MKASEITSAQHWYNLPEIDLPVLKDGKERGAIYQVSKFAYYAASKQECLDIGVKADQSNDAMKYILPIAYAKLENSFEPCRLPIALTSWMLRAILISQRGFDPLPASIEFGERDGQAFAEFS